MNPSLAEAFTFSLTIAMVISAGFLGMGLPIIFMSWIIRKLFNHP
jgi:hypothetical protein